MAAIETAVSELADLSLRELEDELATLASHLYAGTCRWLELVAELDRRGGWEESGRASCAEWLAWRCTLPSRAASCRTRRCGRSRGSRQPRTRRSCSSSPVSSPRRSSSGRCGPPGE